MGLFSVFDHYEHNKNKSHIRNLLEAAISDGNVDHCELEVIIKIAGKYDISRDEVLMIKENPKSVSFSPPSSVSAKVKLLEDLILVIAADEIIETDEINFCREIAHRLDINPAVVDDLVKNHVKY